MFCPKCGAQLPDGSVFCSACGTQIVQQVNTAAEQDAQQAAPVAPVVPKAATAGKYNILGAVFTVLCFFCLFLPFQGEGADAMFIAKPEGWFMILVVLAAGFFVFTKMDSFFMLASCAAIFLCFISLLLIACGAHGTGVKGADELLSLAAQFGYSTSGIKVKTAGNGVTLALTCSIVMLVSPIINRLFAKRK
ncbi:MAG: zinc ribbon domain-containing protein [Lachnospiraceae bacterium]|nr:zinc ribbon domain-containing protein [Lachnospiraceae bacterium]